MNDRYLIDLETDLYLYFNYAKIGALMSVQRLYDADEYKAKILAALDKLEKTEKPGQLSGKSKKTELLQATKVEIQALVDKGYTTKQIATALSNDAFGILPKSITQLISGKRPPVKKRKEPPPLSQPSKPTIGTATPPPVRKGLVETGCSYNPVVTLGDKKESK